MKCEYLRVTGPKSEVISYAEWYNAYPSSGTGFVTTGL